MKEGLRIYEARFEGAYPVGCCLILAAKNQQQAEEMAKETITHTNEIVVSEVIIKEPRIIEYISGDY